MDDVALTPAAPKKMPRAAQASMANGKGKGKSKESSMLGEMATIGFEAYLVGRTAVPPDYASARYSLILNTRGNPDLHKLTVRRHVSGQEDDFECEIFVKDLTSIGFSDALNEEALPHIEFVFSNKDAHAKAVFDKLAEPCEIPDDGAHAARHAPPPSLSLSTPLTLRMFFGTQSWTSTPSSFFSARHRRLDGRKRASRRWMLCSARAPWAGAGRRLRTCKLTRLVALYLLADCVTLHRLRKAVANKRMFDTRKHQVDELDHVVEKRASGRKAKGKRAAPDPHQPKLSYVYFFQPALSQR